MRAFSTSVERRTYSSLHFYALVHSAEPLPEDTRTMTDASNARFNAEAAAWDSNPDVHVATAGALKALLARFPDLEKVKAEGRVKDAGKRSAAVNL